MGGVGLTPFRLGDRLLRLTRTGTSAEPEPDAVVIGPWLSFFKKRAGPQARPLVKRVSFETYQVPLACAEHPPLSAEPVSQVRLVVPFAARASTNVAALESRLDVTVTV